MSKKGQGGAEGCCRSQDDVGKVQHDDPWLRETSFQWPFQDPKMEVLYHIRPYFVGISPYIGLI